MSDSEALVPLPWETRNLGIEAFALNGDIANRADAAAVRSCLDRKAREIGRFFVQARIKMDSRSSRALEQSGFYFVEATLSPVAVFRENDTLTRMLANPAGALLSRHRAADVQVIKLAGDDGASRAAVEEIAAESFIDDRFHVDHNCPSGVADRRYVYWVKDLLEDPAVSFDVLSLNRQPVAFLARRGEQLLIGGFARRYAGAGLGDFLWLQVLRQMKAEGLTRARTLVSVRNFPSLNLHARLGFKFRDPSATFHYWRRAEGES